MRAAGPPGEDGGGGFGGTRVSVTVEFEGDEAKVAAHLERDLKMFRTFAETRG